MDEEYKKKIDRVLKLAEENNEYVRQVRSSQKTSQMFKAIYWVIIGTFALGGFYYIKPYLNTLNNVYSSFGDIGKKATSSNLELYDLKQVQDLIKQIK
ncbi:MAG: hypothetical protein KBC17_01605 [Candidatus Pacebacteria bacterium]|nr:hypothetical protein [Candidatus Paceibacterota bacterium]